MVEKVSRRMFHVVSFVNLKSIAALPLLDLIVESLLLSREHGTH
jgi:hypothetical protein